MAHVKQEWHPNGQIKEEANYNNTQLTDGWSYKSYYPNGQLEQQRCYSHGKLIEQLTFDEKGKKTSHTIWNQRLQQMVDRPVVVPATQTVRPNITGGCMTIYSIAEILPLAADLIDAPDQSSEMMAAHDRYYGYYDDDNDDEWEERSDEPEYWTLKGRKGSFTVTFERHEGYLFYNIHTPDINDYEKARQLVNHAQNRYKLYRYFSEETILEKADETGKPILHYIAPYRNRTCLEKELTVWGKEPVYSLLANCFIFYITRVEENNENDPHKTTFLESLPDWGNIVKGVRQGHVYYIIQTASNGKIPIISNPSPAAFEDFLVKHQLG